MPKVSRSVARRARRCLVIDGADLLDRTPCEGLPDGWGFDWQRWRRGA